MLTRRTLLIDGLRISALLPLTPRLLGRASGDSAGKRVLVVLELNGGNDGLNTVVPWSQDTYWRLRPSLGLARGSLHRIDDDVALHPQLAGLAELYHEGSLSIVHGAGLPEPNRSHFRSLEIWHTAQVTGAPGEVGWLGRLADQLDAQNPGGLPALSLDADQPPLSTRASRGPAPVVRDPAGFRLADVSDLLAREREALLAAPATGDLAYLTETARATYDTARRMTQLARDGARGDYPGGDLARRFALIAQLVDGGFGTQVFHVSHAGFDTHARQLPVHAERMRIVDGALAAFQRDLEARGIADRVVTFVFSEFGRRAAENGSKGTDHGHGAPCFVMGAQVRGGQLGERPDLERLVDGDVPSTTDFRAVYSELESSWLGLEPSTSVAPLDLLQARASRTR